MKLCDQFDWFHDRYVVNDENIFEEGEELVYTENQSLLVWLVAVSLVGDDASILLGKLLIKDNLEASVEESEETLDIFFF